MTTLLNLTPHPICLHRADGSVLTLAPEPAPARIAEIVRPAGTALGLPLVRITPGDTQDLPPPRPGTLLIVSAPVALAHHERDDLVTPHDFLRDSSGRILGCRALAFRPPS